MNLQKYIYILDPSTTVVDVMEDEILPCMLYSSMKETGTQPFFSFIQNSLVLTHYLASLRDTKERGSPQEAVMTLTRQARSLSMSKIREQATVPRCSGFALFTAESGLMGAHCPLQCPLFPVFLLSRLQDFEHICTCVP